MKPRNLLFIISDQHNRNALGCYGHPLVRTPHLDQLAEDGVCFDSAYTNCPICVPARASLATGMYVNQIGHWDNAFPYDGRVTGWGHRLIESGHRVESIGKLHHRQDSDPDGFQTHHIPLNVVDGIGDVMGSIRDDPPVRRGSRDGIVQAGPGDSTYLRYDERIAETSVNWLRKHGSTSDAPWVLFVSFVCPHPPYIAPPDLYSLYPLDQIPLPAQSRLEERPGHPVLEKFREVMEWREPFSETEMKRMVAAYLGCCTHLDQQIGRVLDALAECGLRDSTRIIYTSDHGESMGRHGLWGKFTMYEDSAGIPLIVSGPDLPQGTRCSTPVTLVDMYPSILEGAGIDRNGVDELRPGSSIWPLAGGESQDRSAFSEYHAVGCEHGYYMLRRGRWKLIHYVNHRAQLFDLESDPEELSDRAGDPETAQVMDELEAELHRMVDPVEVDRQARADQQALVERYGGRQAVLERGTFTNSPVPGEVPRFQSSLE